MTNAVWSTKRAVVQKPREGGWSNRSLLKRLNEAEKFRLNYVGPKLSKGLLAMDGFGVARC